VEVKPVGESFTGQVSAISEWVENGSDVFLPLDSITNGECHWRARTENTLYEVSDWVSFGDNSEDEPDFICAISTILSCSSVEDTNLQKDSAFSVQISIQNITDLYVYEFKLSFDPAVIEYTDCSWGPFFMDTTYYLIMKEGYASKDDGILWFAISRTYPAESVSGSGVLLTLNFKALVDEGESKLNLWDTKFGDSMAKPIIHAVEDGFFSNLEQKEEASTQVMQTMTVSEPEPLDLPGSEEPSKCGLIGIELIMILGLICVIRKISK
jgi:hypothetical protein